jgi:O-antigen/teichoic acid export membrane protein
MMQPDAVVKDLRDTRESSARTLGIESARKGFLVNVSSNIAFMAIQAVVSLWFTPYLIGHLGIAVYGMVPLVNSVTAYMQIFTRSLNAAVTRFLTIDLEKGDKLTANKTFNTALFGLLGVIVALSPVVLALSLAFPYIFDVPPGWERDVRWLFAAVAVAFFVSVIGSNFAVSSFAHSQFLLRNVVEFAALLARIGFVVALFSLLSPRLWHIGGGVLIAVLASFLGHVLLWRKLTPELRVRITAFDRSRLRSLTGMGGWVTVNRVGAMLLRRVDLIVVNTVFGAAMTGGYGSVLQFSILIDSLAGAASTVVTPVIVRKYAQRDFVGLQRLCSQAVKLLGLALALPVGLLCGFSRPLLSIWLGPSFQDLDVLLVFVVAHLTLNLSVLPLAYVQSAYNKVRWPGIVTLLSGGANLGLAILLALWGGWGVVGVAVAGAVTWTAKNALYMPIYTARIMKSPWWTYLPSLSAGVVGTFSVGMAAYGLTLLQIPNSWLTLASSAAIVSLLYAIGVFWLGLSRTDLELLIGFLPWSKKN